MISLKDVTLGPDEYASKALARFPTSNHGGSDCIPFKALGIWGYPYNRVLEVISQGEIKLTTLFIHPPVIHLSLLVAIGVMNKDSLT